MTVDSITSRSNSTLLRAASLKEKKYRDRYGLFMAEGIKLTLEAISAGMIPETIFLMEGKGEQYLPMLSAALENTDTRIFVVSEPCFEKISTEKAPEGVISLIKHLDFYEKCIKIDGRNISSACAGRAVLLQDVRDPGNLGAILRSAAAFGCEQVLLSGHCVDLYHPRVLRSAMGALFRLRFAYLDAVSLLADALHAEGRRLLAAELREQARSLADVGARKGDVFVIGNEGHGLPEEVSALCDESVYIPIAEGTESLNAAVAASVLLYEQSRRGDTV